MTRVTTLLVAALVLTASPAAAGPSTYSRSSGGAKAFYMLLEDLGYKVSRSFSFKQPGNADVVALLGNTREVEQERLLKWVRGGKLALVALPLISEKGFCADLKLGSVAIKREAVYGKGVEAIDHPELKVRPSACAMKLPEGGTLLVGSAERALAVELPLGRGKLLLLAHEDLVVNANLNQDDLVVQIRRWLSDTAPAGGRVVFLETRRGGGMGLISMLSKAGLGPFLLHGLIFLLLLYWSKAPRFGDPRPAFVETRREFSQHARALGHLYQHRRASGHALQQQYERFLDRLLGRPDMAAAGLGARASASQRARLRGNRAGIAALIATRTGRDADSIEGLLAQVEYAMTAPGPYDAKDIQRHYRLSQALAALQHTTPGRTSGEKRGRSEIR